MKKKIISAVLSVVIVLSAFIIVPMTREVEAEAAYDARYSMYQNMAGVFLPSRHEGNGVRNATTWSLNDGSAQASKLTVSAASNDPYYGFEVAAKCPNTNFTFQAGSSSSWTYLVLVAKVNCTTNSNPAFNFYTYFNWGGPYGFANVSYTGNVANNGAGYKSGQYNYYICNFAGVYSNRNGQNVTGLRFDYLDSNGSVTWNAGDSVELDSFAFFTGTQDEAWAAAYYYGEERIAVRNKSSNTYTITPNQFNLNAFSDHHNVNVSYTSSYGGAFQLTTANNCSYVTSGGGAYSDSCPNGGGKYRCWNAVNSGLTDDAYQSVLDPVVYLNCNVDTSKYKYAVISFMLPYDANAATLARAGLTKGMTAIYDARGETANHTSIVPQFSGTTYSITSTYQFGLNGYFYTQIIDLSAAGGNGLTRFRIDPIEYTFSKLGISLYLKQITFATDAATAMSSAESMLRSMSNYASFQLATNYNGNPLSGTSANNVPGTTGNIYQYVSISNQTYYDYTLSGTTPTSNTGIKFDGWALTSNGDVVAQPGGSCRVNGANGTVTKPTFYAKWHYMYGTMTLTAANTADNIDTNQTYLFRVSGTGADPAIGAFNILIPLKTGQSMSFSLPCGTYSVTCVDGWSWRYGLNNLTRTVTINADNQTYSETFDFTSGKNESWINKYYDTIIS